VPTSPHTSTAPRTAAFSDPGPLPHSISVRDRRQSGTERQPEGFGS
jgi:hypothetical protein